MNLLDILNKKNENGISTGFVFYLFTGLVALSFITSFVFCHYFPELIFKNYSFAFSLPVPIGLIYGIYAVVLVFCMRYVGMRYVKMKYKEILSWVLVFSGAFSNIAERISLGYVRDYIHIGNGVLNCADFFILVGVILLLIGPGSET